MDQPNLVSDFVIGCGWLESCFRQRIKLSRQKKDDGDEVTRRIRFGAPIDPADSASRQAERGSARPINVRRNRRQPVPPAVRRLSSLVPFLPVSTTGREPIYSSVC